MGEIRLEYSPRGGQLELHELMSRHRFGVAAAHRRFGKTVWAVMTLIHAVLNDRSGDGRYAYLAPYRNQAKDIAWDMFKARLVGVPNVKFNESELRIEFGNGSRVRLYGADNPDALRGGYFDGVVIDEVGDMKPAVWDEVLRPALSDRRGWGIFIGTPKGFNLFYDIYCAAEGNSDWFARKFRASETGVIAADELENAKASMSPSAYAREFECDFGAARDDVVIPVDIIEAAVKRELKDIDVQGGVRVLGIDVARYGDDASVIFPVAGLKAYEPVILRKVGNYDVAQAVMRKIATFEPDYVRIDAGRGEGVIDILRQHGHRVMEVNFGARAQAPVYANARAEMWHGMRGWLERGGCIPNDAVLMQELGTPTYYYNASNKMVLESKESMRLRGVKSPDLADALALAVGVPLRVRGALGGGSNVVNKSKGLITSERFGNAGRKTRFERT